MKAFPVDCPGCGLRRAELAKLEVRDIQQREEDWAVVDLIGKGRHIRTVPVPGWVKAELDAWMAAAQIADGRVFRAVNRIGSVWGTGTTEEVVWHIVKHSAKQTGLQKLAPMTCPATCSMLFHAAGGELEPTRFLLGHASGETPERHLGLSSDCARPSTPRSGSTSREWRRVGRLLSPRPRLPKTPPSLTLGPTENCRVRCCW